MIQFDGHSATICSLAFSPDSMTLASGAKDGSIRLWDASGVMVRDVSCVGDWNHTSLAWIPSGQGVAFADLNRVKILRPVMSSAERQVDTLTSFPTDGVNSLIFITDTLLAAGIGMRNDVGSGRLRLWDIQQRKERTVSAMVVGYHFFRAVTVHQPTKRLHWIAGLPDTTACIWRSWDITKPNATDVKLGKPASDITVSPDGAAVAIASEWLVKVFAADGKPRTELTGHKGRVSGVGFVNSGRTVVSASWDETVRLWDVATGKETARFPLGIGKLTALAVSPDGTRIAVGGTDGPIVLLDAE